ncbi:MAG: plastocyanin/azurin family copper-binding protein [Thermoleophilia bacterium]
MRRARVLTGSLLVAAVSITAGGAALAASAPGSAARPIAAKTDASHGFAPGTVTVRPGAKVHFKSVDGAPHNAVAARTAKLPGFRSGAPSTGSFTLVAPKTVGTYHYHCQVHPFMKGVLKVAR